MILSLKLLRLGDGEFVGWQGTDNSAKPLSVCVLCLSVICFLINLFTFPIFICSFMLQSPCILTLCIETLLLVYSFCFKEWKKKCSFLFYWSTQTATHYFIWNCSCFEVARVENAGDQMTDRFAFFGPSSVSISFFVFFFSFVVWFVLS